MLIDLIHLLRDRLARSDLATIADAFGESIGILGLYENSYLNENKDEAIRELYVKSKQHNKFEYLLQLVCEIRPDLYHDLDNMFKYAGLDDPTKKYPTTVYSLKTRNVKMVKKFFKGIDFLGEYEEDVKKEEIEEDEVEQLKIYLAHGYRIKQLDSEIVFETSDGRQIAQIEIADSLFVLEELSDYTIKQDDVF